MSAALPTDPQLASATDAPTTALPGSDSSDDGVALSASNDCAESVAESAVPNDTHTHARKNRL